MPSTTDDHPDSDSDCTASRRRVLRSVGGMIGLSAGAGSLSYTADRSFVDEDGDGIPDRKERSKTFHERVASLFGDGQFEGLDPERRDFLIDVRYVEGTSIHSETKRNIVARFRDNGVYAQWLDYPTTYDRDAFEANYGPNVKALLWSQDSFYRQEIEPVMRDIAVQLLVVPGRNRERHTGLVYSPWANVLGSGVDGHVNGFSVGNRAVVGDRQQRWEQERIVFHELAHLVLCHDDDPENTGVMGTNEEIKLTDGEWEKFRSGLDNVRDTTGYDIALRRCLWEACLTDVADRVR